MKDVTNARLLIVDDLEANVRLLERLLRQMGYVNITTTTDPRRALPLFLSQQPDIVLLDLQMPYLDGFEVMEQIVNRVPERDFMPILVLTADITAETRQKALSMGAHDFVSKPFDHVEVLLRIKNLLQTRLLHSQVMNQNKLLEEAVRERTADLEGTQLEILDRLALAAEYRDDDTGQHTQRVGRTCALVARELGLSAEMTELIRHAAPLHDVGKIGIPDEILLKPGPLTEEEFDFMKTHTTLGAQMLSGGRFLLLQMAEEICLTHHERWDGTGYAGLAGDDIPLIGRIVAIADVFDALSFDRPYKKAWSREDAIHEIQSQRGAQFDPAVVDAFLAVLQRQELTGPAPRSADSRRWGVGASSQP